MQTVTSRKVEVSIPSGALWNVYSHSPSGYIMLLRSSQPLTQMSTWSISWG